MAVNTATMNRLKSKIKVAAGPVFCPGPPAYGEVFPAQLLTYTRRNEYYFVAPPSDHIYDGYLADSSEIRPAAFPFIFKTPPDLISEAHIAGRDSRKPMNNKSFRTPKTIID